MKCPTVRAPRGLRASLPAGRPWLAAATVALLPGATLIPDPAQAGVARGSDSGRVVAERVAEVRRELLPLIPRAMARYQVPGLSLTLVNDREVLWAEGFGFADLRRRVPATPRTLGLKAEAHDPPLIGAGQTKALQPR